MLGMYDKEKGRISYDPDIMVQEGGKEAKKQVAWNLLDHCKYMVRLFCV